MNPVATPLDRVGFYLSLAGIAGVAIVGPFGSVAGYIGMAFSILSVPGFIVSLVALARKRTLIAKWGVAIGLFGSGFLPTFYISVARLLR